MARKKVQLPANAGQTVKAKQALQQAGVSRQQIATQRSQLQKAQEAARIREAQQPAGTQRYIGTGSEDAYLQEVRRRFGTPAGQTTQRYTPPRHTIKALWQAGARREQLTGAKDMLEKAQTRTRATTGNQGLQAYAPTAADEEYLATVKKMMSAGMVQAAPDQEQTASTGAYSDVAPGLYKSTDEYHAAGGAKPPATYDEMLRDWYKGAPGGLQEDYQAIAERGGWGALTPEEAQALIDPNAYKPGEDVNAWEWMTDPKYADASRAAYVAQLTDAQAASASGVFDTPDNLLGGNIHLVSGDYLDTMQLTLPFNIVGENIRYFNETFAMPYRQLEAGRANDAVANARTKYGNVPTITQIYTSDEYITDDEAYSVVFDDMTGYKQEETLNILIELDNGVNGTNHSRFYLTGMTGAERGRELRRLVRQYGDYVLMGKTFEVEDPQMYPYDAVLEMVNNEEATRTVMTGYMAPMLQDPRAHELAVYIPPADPTGRDAGSPNVVVNTGGLWGPEADCSLMTDVERSTFNYYYNLGDEETAIAYLDEMAPILQQRKRVLDRVGWEELATDNVFTGGLMWAGSVGANLLNAAYTPIEFVMDAAGVGNDMPNILADYTSTVRGTQEAALGEHDWFGVEFLGKNIPQWLYSTGTSMADMGTAYLVGGATNWAKAPMAIMAAEAAANEYADTAGQGMDPWERGIRAGAVAAVEWLTEKLPFDAFTSNALDVGYIARNILAEAAEEGLSEIGGIGVDVLTSWMYGHENQLQERYQQLRVQGVENPEGVLMSEVVQQVSGAAFGGALAGGGMGAAGVATTYAQYSGTGREITRAGGTDNLVQLGLAMKEGSESRKQAEKIQQLLQAGGKLAKNAVTPARMGRLFRTMMADVNTEYHEDLHQMAVEAVGNAIADKYDALELTDEISEEFTNEELGEAIVTAAETGKAPGGRVGRFIREHRVTAEILREFAGGEAGWTQDLNARRAEATVELMGRMAKIKDTATPAEQSTEEAPTAAAVEDETTTAVQTMTRRSSTRELLSRSVVMRSDDGHEVQGELVRVERSKDGLRLIIRQGDGETSVALNEAAQVSGAGVARILAYAQERAEISSEEINEMVNLLMDSGKGAIKSAELISAYETGVNAGYEGVRELAEVIANATRDAGKAEKAVQAAMEAGYRQGMQQAEQAEQQRTAPRRHTLPNRRAVAFMGDVGADFDGTDTGVRQSVDAIRKSLTEQQRAAVDAIGQISRAVGVNVVLYRTAAEKGQQITAPNGFYDAVQNTVFVDLNSGVSRSGDGMVNYTIMQTMGHELTHFIEGNSTEGYATLRQLVKDTLGKQGKSYMELVVDRARTSQHAKTRAQAEAEVIADACEMMLRDSKAIQQLAQRDVTLAAKIRGFVASFVRRIREAFAGLTAGSREAALISKVQDGVMTYMDGLQAAWDKALIEASGNLRSASEAAQQAAQQAVQVRVSQTVPQATAQAMAAEVAAEAVAVVEARSEDITKALQDTPEAAEVVRAQVTQAAARAAQEVAGEVYQGADEAVQQGLQEAAEAAAGAAVEAEVLAQTVEEAQRQYSLRTLEDGRVYVEEDRNVLSGNNPEVWKTQIQDYINNQIRNGEDVTVYAEDGEALTITSDTAGKARFRNYVTNSDGSKRIMSDSEYATKLRAESHIDELATASLGNGKTIPDTKAHAFAKDGFTYRTAYFKDKSGYYRITISVGKNGSVNTVYNVGKIKEARFPVDKVRGAQRPRGNQASDISVSPAADSVNPDVQFSSRMTDDAFDALQHARREYDAANKAYNDALRAYEADPEFEKMLQPDLSKEEMRAIDDSLVEKYGIREKKRKRFELDKRLKAAEADYETQRAAAEEQKYAKRIAKSGKTPEEYRVAEAKRIFGTTPFFYDAGYMLQDGSLLNFSGEKGMHKGERNLDHRAIGQVYANLNGSPAMLAFMHEGNIRVMAETPGMDIAATVEPTAKQYSKIRQFVREHAEREYMSIDFTDNEGRTAGMLEYEGKRINADRVVNDIKHYYATGEIREQGVGAYLHSERRHRTPTIRQAVSRMKVDERMNETEKLLLGKYKADVAEYERLQGEIDKLVEAMEGEQTPEEKTENKNRMGVLKSQQRRVGSRLRKAEGSEGFARLMRTGTQMVHALARNESLEDVAFELEQRMGQIAYDLEELNRGVDRTLENNIRRVMAGLFDQEAVRKAAQGLKAQYGSSMSVRTIGDRLMAMSVANISGEKPDGMDLVEQAKAFAKELRASGSVDVTGTLENLREALPTIVINESVRKELASRGITVPEYRRVVGRVAKVVYERNGNSGDLLAQMETDAYYGRGGILGAYFGDVVNDADALGKLYDIVSKAMDQAGQLYEGADGEEMLLSDMAGVLQAMLDARLLDAGTDTITSINKVLGANSEAQQRLVRRMTKLSRSATEASKLANRVENALSGINIGGKEVMEYYRRLEEQRRLMDEQDALARMKDEMKGQMADWYREKELREENNRQRGAIRRLVGMMDRRIRKETDQRNIPEGLKPLVQEMVQIFANANDTMHMLPAKEIDEILRVYRALAKADAKAGRAMDVLLQEDMAKNLAMLREDIAAYSEITREGGVTEMLSQQNEILTAMHDIVSQVWKAVQDANTLFLDGKEEQLSAIGAEMGAQLEAMDDYSIRDNALGKVGQLANRELRLNNTTPVYFFRQMGVDVMKRLNDALLSAQGRHARMHEEAKQRIAQIQAKHDYWGWRNNDPLELTTWQGVTQETMGVKHKHRVTLTPDEALSIWAIWKREKASSDLYNSTHLAKGGFVFASGTRTVDGRTYTDKLPHKISEKDIQAIDNWLTPEMKAYADEMVKYMSTDMAEIGNRTSMRLYGIRKFREGYYFPMRVAREQLAQKSDAGAKGEVDTNRIAHFSATKRRISEAKKPLAIDSFTAVAADHVEKMLMYDNFAEPIEAFNKVLNHVYATGEDEDKGEGENINPQSRMTLRALVQQKLGKDAAAYLERYLADVNGGPQVDPADKGFFARGLTAYKKAAVVGSASVVLQQPTSVVRAAMHIDPKYFTPMGGKDTNTEWRKEWAQLREYSGTALIKERGGFDMTGTRTLAKDLEGIPEDAMTKSQRVAAAFGIGTRKGVKAEIAKRQWDEALGWAAQKADQLAWVVIWRAIKKEVAANNKGMDTSSAEFLQMAADRFDEVINLTQVYDSTMVRSANMRSKSMFAKMLTAFMAESTLTANMLIDAATNTARTGNWKAVVRAVAVYAVCNIATAAAAGLPKAGRDDDEDKPWLEKYLASVWGQLGGWGGSMNPLALFPGLRDVMSLLDGYDVERADMNVLSTLFDEGSKLMSGAYADDPLRGVENIAGAIGNMFGVPVKNVSRDLRSVWNTATGLINPPREVSGRMLVHDAKKGLTPRGVEKLIPWLDTSNGAYHQRIYNAMRRGDAKEAEATMEFLRMQGSSDTAIKSGVRKVVQEHLMDGKITDAEAKEFLVSNGLAADSKAAYTYVDEWREKPEHEDEEDYSHSAYNDVYDAVDAGDPAAAQAAMDELIDNGWTQSQINSEVYSHIGQRYMAGEITWEQMRSTATEYAGKTDMDEDDWYWERKKWDYGKANGGKTGGWSKYDAYHQAVETGENLKAVTQEYLGHGVEKGSLKSTLRNKYRDTYRELYKTDRAEYTRLRSRLVTALVAAGYTRTEAMEYVDSWLKD